ncbi:anaerobic glycerol-3-phosphate dehydrogenase subunit C [bacterium BMS3Abin05]|nr:anaerobic glycerol-3-phosphate dehydrogenase subunit C [bacterium BMS3Abin05]
MIDPEKVKSDLKARISGDVKFDEIARILFSTAACMYEIKPMGVVAPKNKNDVIQIVKYAHDHHIPITPRGAGSSLAGQAVGSGIIIDFTKYMNKILEIDERENTVRVQPGVIFGNLLNALKPYRKFFPPDPSSGKFCTLGGMAANNSGGAHSVKYGTTKDHVENLEVVLSNGELIRTQRVPAEKGTVQSPYPENSFADRVFRDAYRVVHDHKELIERCTPKVSKNASGYNLRETDTGREYDFAKLLIGSEGTLSVITEMTLRLTDLPAERAAILVYFDSLDKAGRALVRILESGPSALEIMDRYFFKFVRENDPHFAAVLPPDLEAALLIEYDGNDLRRIREQIEAQEDALIKKTKLAFGARKAYDPEEQARLWAVRSSAWSLINKVKGRRRPQNFIDDVAVDPAKIPQYLQGLYKIFDKYGITAINYGHAGNGNIHVNPLLDLKDPNDFKKLRGLAKDVADLGISLGGTLSGEHGDGLVRSPYLKALWGPVYEDFEKIKGIFDPQNNMNPGKIAGPLKFEMDENLRYGKDYNRIKTNTAFDLKELQDEIEKCHGCGTCRSYCPMALELSDEIATARSKANLLRFVISGKLDPAYLLNKSFKSVIDTCTNCKLCLTECPTNVDIPRIAVEARTYFVTHKGQTLQNKLLEESRFTSKLSSLFAPVSNRMLKLPVVRTLLETTAGIHRSRIFQEFKKPTLESWAKRHKSVLGERKVVYFAGCFANFNDVDGEGRAVVQVLEKNNVTVVTPEFKCCGVAKIALGDRDSVKPDAARNIRIMKAYVEQGYDIVASAASCGLAIKRDWPEILRTEDAELISEHAYDIHEYLWKLHQAGALTLDFQPVHKRVVYHNPCHLNAQKIACTPVDLLKLIPGLEVVEIEDSCCGIAGTFGFKKQNFETSMHIGSRLFKTIKAANPDWITTGCGTCNIQIKQGIGQDVLHPVKILRDAYGTI